MKLHLEKPWVELSAESLRAVPGQLGVYQLSRGDGAVERIGKAGARELFALRSALQRELTAAPAGTLFRYEVNMQYQSRWRELLMLHERDHGAPPPGNTADRPVRLGRMA